MEQRSDWLEKGFQMAYYTVPDRMAAIEIVSGALDKLRVHVHREKKRFYWRDKHLGRPIRKITREADDLLQWLIMVDSEAFEKKEEQRDKTSARDLVVRYVKHLVRLTSANSSFHVNVGLSRLLYSYSTSETQATYEMLTRRYPGPDEYRRVKSVLMKKLSERFRNAMNTTRVEHGEFKFEAFEDQQRWVGLVNEALTMFTPWSTAESCERFRLLNSKEIKLPVYDDVLQNEAEMSWCHVFIDPLCYKRLTTALGFEAPEEKLALPRFLVKDENDHKAPRQTSELSPTERQEIMRSVAARDARRRVISPQIIRVIVDGSECGRLDLGREQVLEIEIDGGSQLLELRAEDKAGDLLLSTFSIPYAGEVFSFSRATMSLHGGKLEIIVLPKPMIGGTARARVAFEYHQRTVIWHMRNARELLQSSLASIRRHALPALGSFVLGVAFVTLLMRSPKTPSSQSSVPKATGAVVSYLLVSDDQRVRDGHGPGSTEVVLGPDLEVVKLELAMPSLPTSATYRADLKTFTEKEDVFSATVHAGQTSAGSKVALHVPAVLLQAGKYYTVHLWLVRPNEQLTEVTRFTFQTLPRE